MKKIHIVGLIIIALSIVAIISLMSNYSTYETFSSAKGETKKEFQIVGYLDKSKEMYYDPQKDPNYFTFYMKDIHDVECRVILYNSMPQDFQKSEQIVVTGKMKGDDFEAKNILMKCPSKYKADEQVFSHEKS